MLQRGFKKTLFFIILSFGFLCFTSMTGAQTRRAFLVGIDEYNPEVLSSSGVRGGEVKGQLSPLEKLLAGVGLRRRGNPPVTHIDWSMERLSIQSKQK